LENQKAGTIMWLKEGGMVEIVAPMAVVLQQMDLKRGWKGRKMITDLIGVIQHTM